MKNETDEDMGLRERPAKRRAGRLGAWRWWRRARFTALLALLLLALVMASPVISRAVRLGRAMASPEASREAALTMLRSEHLLFLVTDKLTTQIVVHATANSPLLGKREGFMVATVTLYYGVDLRTLTPESVELEGTRLLVTLPEPRELDFSVDPTSLRSWTVRSGLNVVADFMLDKDIEAELRQELRGSALRFYQEYDLLPSREAILAKLSALSPVFREQVGIDVVFR